MKCNLVCGQKQIRNISLNYKVFHDLTFLFVTIGFF